MIVHSIPIWHAWTCNYRWCSAKTKGARRYLLAIKGKQIKELLIYPAQGSPLTNSLSLSNSLAGSQPQAPLALSMR